MVRVIHTAYMLLSLNTYVVDVSSTLTALIVDGISSHSMLLDQYVVLHAAFVASLHKIIGVEFGESLRP